MKPLIIANWKMSLSLKESIDLALEFKKGLEKLADAVEVVVCPSFTALPSVQPLLGSLKLGAQDVFWRSKGAYTGEISAPMLYELGCEYVIIGHSERRQNLGETDEMVHKKIKAAIRARLTPIVCVGENFEERKNGQKDSIIIRQVAKALRGIEIVGSQRVVIAYEPVWAIGTGYPITPEEAEHTHRVIRQTLIDEIGFDRVKRGLSIIYGGSIDSETAKSFVARESIDGVLVGQASLRAKEFIQLVKVVGPWFVSKA